MHEVGSIVEGKVTGITKFGAFVELGDGAVGMVHISEVAATYVNDISEHLKEGQVVKVKILNVNDDGKIGLSIKKALPPTEQGKQDGGNRQNFGARQGGGFTPRTGGSALRQGGFAPRKRDNNSSSPSKPKTASQPYDRESSFPKGPANFEDMLSKFMSSTEDKFSEVGLKKQTSNRRSGGKKSPKDYD